MCVNMLIYTSHMQLPFFLSQHILSASASPWLLLFVIILGVMVLEEGTIAVVGVLAASHQIPMVEGIIALVIGVVTGDSLAFAIGHFANRYTLAKRIIEYEHVARLRTVVQNNSGTTIFTTRFMPGFRFATYAACGFFGVAYKRFIPISFASAIVWVTSLFTLSFIFGIYTVHLLGQWRWPILAVLLLILFFFGHRYWKKMVTLPKE